MMEPGMKQYRRLQAGILIFIIFYLVAGLAVAVGSREGELFPFFNGHWFHTAPHRMHDFGVWIVELDGRELPAPAYLESLAAEHFPYVRRFDVYGLIQRLGQAMRDGRPEAAAIRRQLEKTLGDARRVSYELHERDYLAMDLAFKGRITSHRNFGRFTAAAIAQDAGVAHD
jgi:hypothetical protein